MSRITVKASNPRRAVADAPRSDTFGSARDSLVSLRDRLQQPESLSPRYAEMATDESTDDNRHTLNSSLAALTVSALGLAVAGAVTMTSNAQAANPEALLELQQKSTASATIAEPAPATPASPADANGTPNTTTGSTPAQAGSLDGRSTDETSRTAARTELDAAMGAQLATERSKQLSAASDSAAQASREQALASRADQLTSSTSSISAENDRLAKAKKDQADQAAAQAAQKAAAEKAAKAAPTGTLNVAAAKTSVQSVVASSGGATAPMKRGSYTIGARFGAVGSWSRYHTGQDLPAPVGTPIYAAADGVIAPPNGGGWAGNHVVINHGDGATLYAHMSSTAVSVGQHVKAGQLIGYVGMTGRTFGPHLHWEYYPNASTVGNPYTTADPVSWLAARGASI
ncbi:Murein DD-endopeptidase MepM and murein hydrolase activator NlpD, contain LysM domain [Raineyella antarctica]|uniref:Murein DD-endopeptidase MepM and murein hydrolase activator NlpD, contain LysM domain n=1 Tax=Raineyella antarctica TaxID=1577474 RepID=A0A1G6H505_9ACTN|nr:M23 family metallopeptidase [Raineyella antarctica]SDB89332.1 Murein DD-endopeptidase MepM and murein hydrolase activator NlpD, contain LysM domain [Raineyella antarctica]